MRASALFEAARVATISSAPIWLSVPANTLSPACFSTGTDSPVRLLWSTSDVPRSTLLLMVNASPGLTITVSPTRTSSAATSSSRPSRRTSARAGRSSMSARSACRVRPIV